MRLLLTLGADGFFAKHVPKYSHSNDNQCKSDLSLSNGWCEINHNFSAVPSAFTAMIKKNIARIMFPVNAQTSLVANSARIHPEPRLEHVAESTFNWARDGWKESLTKIRIAHKDEPGNDTN